MMALDGQLLVATPRLVDPNFARTVILVLNHDEDGALGVVINRPSDLAVADVLPVWSDAVALPPMVFGGGPVGRDSALAVAIALGGGPPSGFQRVAAGYGLVDLDAQPGDITPGVVGLRIFSGYAGWAAGQLEDEIGEGSWYVVSAAPGDLLSSEPQTLWRQVLRRQPGELAYLASFPDEPSMN
ncbi:MAG: putative transcriptional regulator [Nocardioidaceae bacterium]|jgi:putative transcriptional regulator|nr:putative transcriptional regulator [Nocardioidaceae bacterium]MDX6309379.1 putative transcriptional regulator [Nocardioidaceae bacterium]